MKIIAHRGSSGHYPENTLLAFEHALLEKADGIELDVHLTKDRKLVVIHDETINRTSNGKGWIKDLTLQELKHYHFNGKFIHCTPQYIPTLNDVFCLLEKYQFDGIVNIEIKTDRYQYPHIVDIVLEEIQKKKRNYTIMFSGFHLPTLIELYQKAPQYELGLLYGKKETYLSSLLEYPFIQAIHPNFMWIKENASELFCYGKTIRPYTINKKEDMIYAKQLHMESIITDYPKKAKRYTKGREIWKK